MYGGTVIESSYRNLFTAQALKCLTMSSAAAPNQQREANPGDRPSYDPKTHLS